MILLHIPEFKQDNFLRCAGYSKHPKYGHGYIREIDYQNRWHAYGRENNVEIHFDTTINGLHKVRRSGLAENEERDRLIFLREKFFDNKLLRIKLKNKKGEFPQNLKELQRRHVILRKVYNPFRYILGPLKIIES